MKQQIYNYDERLRRSIRRIRALRNGEVALGFIDHLLALGLSKARVSKYAGWVHGSKMTRRYSSSHAETDLEPSCM